MRLRESIAYLWVVGIVVGVAGFAWLSRHPDAKVVERATRWPVMGPLAERFRSAYLPSSQVQAEETTEPPATSRPDRVSPATHDELYGARPYVWVQAGARLFAEPDPESRVVEISRATRNLAVVAHQGDWHRVSVRDGDEQRLLWVRQADVRDTRAPISQQPDPVVPLPADAIELSSLATARGLMRDGGTSRPCGDYRLLSDVQTHPAIELCAPLTAHIESLFLRRYGLVGVGPPAETILLFDRARDYREFRDREQVAVESNLAHALASRGYLALYRGDRPTLEILETLVHELAHLVTRRTLGPALPPWLAEGLADDLAQSRIDEHGAVIPDRLGGQERRVGGVVLRTGGQAAALALVRGLDSGRLPRLVELVDMDPVEFYDPQHVEIHYAISSAWVRHLVGGFDGELAKRFREFLRDTAAGEPLTPERLQRSLGRDWTELERYFRTWLRLQFLVPLGEIPDRVE